MKDVEIWGEKTSQIQEVSHPYIGVRGCSPKGDLADKCRGEEVSQQDTRQLLRRSCSRVGQTEASKWTELQSNGEGGWRLRTNQRVPCEAAVQSEDDTWRLACEGEVGEW